jgi:hypothetical protein
MYLFDAVHRHVPLDLLVHHAVSVGVVLLMQYVRTFTVADACLSQLFAPMLVPGITFGDILIDGELRSPGSVFSAFEC